MPIVPIEEASDSRLSDYVRLREVSLRKLLETEQGLFIAEGDKVIRRAVQAGYRPRSFLLAERWLPGLADVTHRWPDVPIYLMTEQLVEAVTGFHVHRGALASLHREQRHRLEDLLTSDRVVVVEDVVDHTNVGAIIRNAAGLGWDGVILAPRAADPLYRRSIKVSMGAVFSLPWARLSDWQVLRLCYVGPASGPWLWRLPLTPSTWRASMGNSGPRNGWPSCWVPKAAACRPRGRQVQSCARRSRCLPASTRSMSRPRRRSPATCWARSPPVREA